MSRPSKRTAAAAAARPASHVAVWLLFVFAWVGNYLVRMAYPALLPPIMADLGLDYAQAGVLAGALFASYALAQLPAGLLGDRFGRRRVLLLGLVAGALSSAATGLAVSFAALLAARLATGLAQGCLFSNDRAIIAFVTPPEKISLGQAVSFTGPGIGITAGLLLAGALGEVMPWRHVFLAFAAPPLVAALLIRLRVPAMPPAATSTPLAGRLGRVAREPDLWRLAVATAAVMWVQYVLATWAPALLTEAGVAELGRAGLYASLQGVAGAAGLVGGGWVADRAFRRGLSRQGVVAAMILAVGVAMLGFGAAVHAGAGPAALTAGLVVVSVLAWALWGPTFALLGDLFAGRDLSTAFGCYNSVCVLGAVFGPIATGWTRDLTGSFAAGCYVSAAVALGGFLLATAIRPAPRAASP